MMLMDITTTIKIITIITGKEAIPVQVETIIVRMNYMGVEKMMACMLIQEKDSFEKYTLS